MNVIELIKELEAYEPTRQVVISTDHECEVNDIREVKIADSVDNEYYPGMDDISDMAVVLEA